MIAVSREALTKFLDGALLLFEGFSSLTPSTQDDEWAKKAREYREKFRVVAASPMGDEVMVDDALYAELMACCDDCHCSLAPAGTVAGPAGGPLGKVDWAKLFALVEKLLPIILPLIVAEGEG